MFTRSRFRQSAAERDTERETRRAEEKKEEKKAFFKPKYDLYSIERVPRKAKSLVPEKVKKAKHDDNLKRRN